MSFDKDTNVQRSGSFISFASKYVDLRNRFHVAVRLFSNRSQMTSKCGKKIFTNIADYYLRKMRGYPQFSFWISITLVKPGSNGHDS